MTKLRSQLSDRQRLQAKQQMAAHWQAQVDHFAWQHVAAYATDGTEPDCFPLLGEQQQVYFPRMCSRPGQMSFYRVGHHTQLIAGRWGMLEPAADCVACDLTQLDCVLVPAVAIDQRGTRLGRGGGYYDRFLYKCRQLNPRCVFVALVYAFQCEASIDSEAWDIPMDYALTEQGWSDFTAQPD